MMGNKVSQQLSILSKLGLRRRIVFALALIGAVVTLIFLLTIVRVNQASQLAVETTQRQSISELYGKVYEKFDKLHAQFLLFHASGSDEALRPFTGLEEQFEVLLRVMTTKDEKEIAEGIQKLSEQDQVLFESANLELITDEARETLMKVKTIKQDWLSNTAIPLNVDRKMYTAGVIDQATYSNGFNTKYKASQVEEMLTLIYSLVEANRTAVEKVVFASNAQLAWLLKMVVFGGVFTLVIIGFTFFQNRKGFNHLQVVSEELKHNAEEFAKHGESLSKSSIGLSNSVENQGNAVSTLASALHEINTMAQSTVDHSNRSSEVSSECSSDAQSTMDKLKEVSDSVEQIRVGIESIANQSEESNSQISQIIEFITELSSKVTVINDIVFQTKLLSFNASVEAARAGAAGKGFAVVAEEVGNLATMSGKAATEIDALIGESVRKVEDIISKSAEATRKNVSKGVSLAEDGSSRVIECNSVMEDFLSKFGELNNFISEIKNAAEEQQLGFKQTETAVQGISETSKQESENAVDLQKIAESINRSGVEIRNCAFEIGTLIEGTADDGNFGVADSASVQFLHDSDSDRDAA